MASEMTPALLGLVGVLAGAIIGGSVSFISAWIAPKRALSLKVWEKLLDRRIAAHENVVQLAIRSPTKSRGVRRPQRGTADTSF
jgi:hypothetical protein